MSRSSRPWPSSERSRPGASCRRQGSVDPHPPRRHLPLPASRPSLNHPCSHPPLMPSSGVQGGWLLRPSPTPSPGTGLRVSSQGPFRGDTPARHLCPLGPRPHEQAGALQARAGRKPLGHMADVAGVATGTDPTTPHFLQSGTTSAPRGTRHPTRHDPASNAQDEVNFTESHTAGLPQWLRQQRIRLQWGRPRLEKIP